MALGFFSSLFSFLVIFMRSPTPVVIWYGPGDMVTGSGSMDFLKTLIKDRVPGIHIHSISMSNSSLTEKFYGYFGSVNEQVNEACRQISLNPELKNGYNAIGFSQGSLFLRAVAQRCPVPQMKNLISFGGQHQGINAVPDCNDGWPLYCSSRAKRLLNKGAYTWFSQNYIVMAQYWHDPLNEVEYRKRSSFLADINNENELNESYRKNLMKLENFVLVKFENDSKVIPPESQWFGYYSPGQASEILGLRQTRLYEEDRLGLKEMDEAEKLHFVRFKGNHLQFSVDWFQVEIVDKFLT